jgi:glutamine amidotransferase
MTADAEAILGADRVILPGVGAAAPAMARLNELNLVPLLRGLRQPLLGICLGMQLLFEGSEEGDVDCLGLVPGRVRRMPASPGVRVPHMGWNRLRPTRDDVLLAGVADGAQAYFVHSYAAPVTDDCLASCDHGQPFAAMVRRGNVAGAQFHPERSGAVGARLLQNFLQAGTA